MLRPKLTRVGLMCRSFRPTQATKTVSFINREAKTMTLKHAVIGILAAVSMMNASMLLPTAANAQVDPKVARAMSLLKADSGQMGAPKVEGTEAVAGKTVPALFFGTTKMNNYFTVVDNVVKAVG